MFGYLFLSVLFLSVLFLSFFSFFRAGTSRILLAISLLLASDEAARGGGDSGGDGGGVGGNAWGALALGGEDRGEGANGRGGGVEEDLATFSKWCNTHEARMVGKHHEDLMLPERVPDHIAINGGDGDGGGDGGDDGGGGGGGGKKKKKKRGDILPMDELLPLPRLCTIDTAASTMYGSVLYDPNPDYRPSSGSGGGGEGVPVFLLHVGRNEFVDAFLRLYLKPRGGHVPGPVPAPFGTKTEKENSDDREMCVRERHVEYRNRHTHCF